MQTLPHCHRFADHGPVTNLGLHQGGHTEIVSRGIGGVKAHLRAATRIIGGPELKGAWGTECKGVGHLLAEGQRPVEPSSIVASTCSAGVDHWISSWVIDTLPCPVHLV